MSADEHFHADPLAAECLAAHIRGADCDRHGESCYDTPKSKLVAQAVAAQDPILAMFMGGWVRLLMSLSIPGWHGGILHCQVDDLNIDMDSGITSDMTTYYGRRLKPEEHVLAAGWDAMTIPQRALAVTGWELFGLWHLDDKADAASD